MKVHDHSLSIISSAILKRRGSNDSEGYSHTVLGDHHIVARQTTVTKHKQQTMTVFSRGHGIKLNTIAISVESQINEVNGKWALLVECLHELDYQNEYVYSK